MAVKLRLARVGKTNAPFFRVVAIDSRKKRDGAFLENLGTYDPKGKFVQFHEERIAYWVSQGAIQTDAFKKLHKLYRKQGLAQG
jgi:small subunit ribosomal protein S16